MMIKVGAASKANVVAINIDTGFRRSVSVTIWDSIHSPVFPLAATTWKSKARVRTYRRTGIVIEATGRGSMQFFNWA